MVDHRGRYPHASLTSRFPTTGLLPTMIFRTWHPNVIAFARSKRRSVTPR